MKYIRFYQEFSDEKTKKVPTGNVIAVETDLRGFPNYFNYGGGKVNAPCVSAIFEEPNSECIGDDVSKQYLQENTKRISEAKARKIHPNLFKYLDSID
ncbi:MAG: hypothetical protein KAS66_16350 [Candidatus Omnitrophica bacterium]|nr:hypothetical protein [Candidatus Omnitrophota bacterium]